MGEKDVVINAAGSMPGDLQALWQARSPLQYRRGVRSPCIHEVPAAKGVRACPPRRGLRWSPS